jgi:hypothetical protein
MSYLRVTIWLLICYLLGPTSLWADLSVWSLIFSAPPSSGENWGVVTSSWTRHQTWRTSVPDRATGGLEITDRTPLFEQSWSTVFDRIVASSSCVASFFTDVAGLVMCSIWKDHPMTSIFVFYALKFLWWITGLPSIEKSLYLVLTCHDFHPLVVSDDLNGRRADCVHLQA